MPSRLNQCLTSVAQPRHYTREQWFALLLGLVCLGCDVWAIIRTATDVNRLSRDPTLSVELFVIEGLLVLAALSLFVFAFSAPPSSPPSPKVPPRKVPSRKS